MMSTASTTPMAAAVVVPKPRPYRRYLTSALHTRFVHAVLLALLNSLFVAFWTGKDYFWSWFPLGPAGLKAALFSMSSLLVFVLQLATLSVGRKTYISPLTTLRALLFDTSTYQTVFWYVVSAWWFCEAYIWAVPENYNMGWVTRGNLNTPDRLNERPIYLRFFFTVLALVQSGLHVYFGQSYLHIPVSKPPTPQSADQQTHPIASIQAQLQQKLPLIGIRSLLASGVATTFGPFIYRAFFRDLFWKAHLVFAKPFFNLTRADAEPPRTYFIGAILGWAFIAGVMLSATWEIAAHSFLIYLKQAPLRNGLPLSASSKDPNGSLLNGLTAKRSVVKTFAFWELALIAQRYPDRRKAIFTDFERPNGPMWTSMSKALLSVVSDIDARILALNAPAPQPNQDETQPIQSLPRITRDASKTSVFAALPPASTQTQKFQGFIANTNAKLGQSKNPWSPPIKETQQKLLEYAKPAIGPGGNDLQKSVNNALKTSPIGGLFRTSPARNISGVVLGSPTGNAAIVVDAIESLTKMLVASLNEDDFGKAVQTVPDAVKQFSRTVMLIESYIGANVQTSTVDVEKELEEVSIIVVRLKAALRELLAAFQVFLNDAGLSIKDLNEAKRASEERMLLPQRQQSTSNTQRPEMEQASQPRNYLDSGSKHHSWDDPRGKRAQETAQYLRRIESQPKRQRILGSEGNVFGARDFSSNSGYRGRETEKVR